LVVSGRVVGLFVIGIVIIVVVIVGPLGEDRGGSEHCCRGRGGDEDGPPAEAEAELRSHNCCRSMSYSQEMVGVGGCGRIKKPSKGQGESTAGEKRRERVAQNDGMSGKRREGSRRGCVSR
jgi:hypothetical protein